MKIYTKILIGMAVGAVIGLTLGPKSSFLEHDTYAFKEVGEKHVFLLDRNDADSRLAIPATAEMRFRTLEVVTADVTNKKGETVTLPRYIRGSFKFTKQMGLLDKSGELKKLLGDPDSGDRVEAWLVIEQTELSTGEFIPSTSPVSGFGDTLVRWLSPIGKIFLALITMVIVPLVFSSLLVGVASLGDVRKLGRLGGKTLGLYLCTTAMAVTIGLGMAHIIQPGNFVSEKDRAALEKENEGAASKKLDDAAGAKSVIEQVINIIPTNPVKSLAEKDMLQIIFFAILFGIALTMLKEERSRQIIDLFDTVQHAMIVIIHIVMAIAPFGVAALIAEVIGQSGLSVLKALMVYAITVIIGLAILGTFVYGGLVKFVARLPFVGFLKAARPAQLIAFSTSSSSAALPVTLECAEENMGVSNSVSSFVVPLGSTVNMDGTALYQGVAAVFIAQVFQVDLTLGAQIGIILAAVAASIGAAGVPGAGMITLALVLETAGIPPVGIALVIGVDRLLDMFRTAVNVTGDLAVTAVMARSEGEKLRLLSPDADAVDPRHGFEGRLDRDTHAVSPSDDPLDGNGEGGEEE